ncbi:MAG: DUF1553 domain-containing protein [Mariniblastus sp.]|nr:DUF1553 domain-containing protein [Mariniblastus sp.]
MSNIIYCPPFFAVLAVVVSSASCLTAQETDKDKSAAFTSAQIEFFENKVRPLLIDKCFSCHGPESKPLEGGLNLSSRKGVLFGGDSGPALVAGAPEESLLIDVINYGDVYEMPPDTKMSAEEIGVLTKWVKDGAAWPETGEAQELQRESFDLEARKASHWVWKPIKKPRVPAVENAEWPAGPVDNFVLKKLELAGLTPAVDAERRALIRRVYFDLIGLPPTPEKVESFVSDETPDAFEKVVDELLESDRFGERWARHWMDLTRYAESGGHEFDYEIRNAFRYRDYLIRAFNEDVSYKQLLQEHIAGDLLARPRRHATEDYNESILGTGFWFLGEAKHSPVDAKAEEARTIDNQIDVMSKTFLGMTVACARCHDHKFDAISTEDYYALSGFLQSSRRQSAMLDPGRKIESRFKDASNLVDQGNALSLQILDGFLNSDSATIKKYLVASLEILRSDPEWNQPAPQIIEGESLKQISVAAGEVSHQAIAKQKDLTWSGNKHLFWKGGEVGSELVLEFSHDGPAANVLLSGDFTQAIDYGIAKVVLNGSVVLERLDLFASKLGKKRVSFGKVPLLAGANRLAFVLLDSNPAAKPGQMIGLDFIELQGAPEVEANSLLTVTETAKQAQLDSELLQRLVDAIKDPSAASNSNPFNLLQLVSKKNVQVNEGFSGELNRQAEARLGGIKKWDDDTTVFADFSKGLPEDWYRTGFAFDVVGQAPVFSAVGSLLDGRTSVNSGRYGAKFCGVIRSPTFELKQSHIHYLCRGRNATIRLVIDGYTMDEFNALLFQGCKFNIRDSAEFHWETQSGDIRNQLGRRAHIEIIDHGHGFVELEQIRFSNGARPVDPVSEVFADQTFDSLAGFVEGWVNGVVAKGVDSSVTNTSTLIDYLIERDLVGLFLPSSKSSSVHRAGKYDNYVSVESPIRKSSEHVLVDQVSQLKAIRERLKEIDRDVPEPVFAMALTDGTGEDEKVFIRGNHKNLGAVAPRHFLSAISDRALNPQDGSGRLQLAQKMTAPNNPLTTRVAVNRIWHHLFGRGIVGSVDNFGVLGELPTHPELLDYLAKEFASDGQSIKRLIKRLVLTRTYRMASKSSSEGESADPGNLLLHHARIRRLQGEAIRDSMLSVAGNLDLKMYGPPVPVHLTSFMSGRGRPRASGPVDGAGRRSVYISVRRNFLSPMMLAFDTPIPFNAIGARNKSNVPAQALILLNDPFVIGQAKIWAGRLIKQGKSRQQRINDVYLTAIGRPPTTIESQNASDFIDLQAKSLGVAADGIDNNLEVWRDFCHVVINLKEFIYIR